MITSESLQQIINDNPTVTTIDAMLEICKTQGIVASKYQIYFAGKSVGRTLKPVPPVTAGFTEEEMRELALTFYMYHDNLEEVLRTLDELDTMNRSGERVPWELDNHTTSYTWELSVGQELIDRAGSTATAKALIRAL